MRKTFLIVPVLLALLVPAAAFAQQPKLELEQTFKNLKFTRPLYLTAPGDGTDRLFVLEQGGRVVWFENKPDVQDYQVALDFRQQTGYIKNEEGLLGIAFHPKVKENKEVFLHYTAEGGMKNVLARFRMNDDLTKIDPASKEVLFTLEQPYWNHNGGMIAFGPDEYLYIALGDGGSRDDPLNNGQNPKTWFAAILRIDVDSKTGDKAYGIPKDNPFAAGKEGAPEVFAYGLRNVWRFSFDRKTGHLWAGDVGQDLWEMIYIIEKGGNYGWPAYEGSHKFTKKNGETVRLAPGTTHIKPIVEHPHSAAKSITGGYVYRGDDIPALRGAYVYGDYQTGLMWYLRYDYETEKLTQKPTYIGHIPEIASFGEDKNGELYVINLKGPIYRIKNAK